MTQDQQFFQSSSVINLAKEYGLVTTPQEVRRLEKVLSNARQASEHMEAILGITRKTSIDWHVFTGAVRGLEKIGITGLDQIAYLQYEMIVEALNNGLISSQEDAQRLLEGMSDFGLEI